MICIQCRREFKPKRPTRKFCSHTCHSDSMRIVDLLKLRLFVATGVGKSRMARELGVQRSTVRGLITNLGLEALWRQRRYHGAGSDLATTARAAPAANTRSANTA